MVKYRKRVSFKGKRWPKGQSSSSNPEANKFRNAAKSRFFQENLSNSGLTEFAVRTHELMYGSKHSKSSQSLTDISDNVSEAESSLPGATFKTFETFASDWSHCSNVSFNKLLNNFTMNSALHKEMLAILAAVTEVIKEKEGTENATEYFAALMTLVDGITQDDETTEESACAMLSLLSMVIKAVPQPVLQLKFSDTSKTLLDLLSKYAQSNNQSIMRSIIGCLSVLLRAQDIGVWSQQSTMKVYESILSFCTHSRPKIRKAAQHACCAILKASACTEKPSNENEADNKPVVAHHPAVSVTATYIVRNIELNPALGGSTTTLHVLGFLKDIIGSFNKANVKACCESILKVMTLGNIIVISTGLQTLHHLFLSKPCPQSTCSPQLNAQIINALYDYQPPTSDVQPTLAWLTTLQQAFCNLALIDLDLCISNLHRFMSICTPLWLSEKIDVVNGVTHTITVLIEDCIEKAANSEHVDKYKTSIRKVFELFEKGLTYQYNPAWKRILHVLKVMFKSSGHTCHEFMTKCLQNLAELRDSYNFPHVYELDFALGAAVRSMGPEIVLKYIPYQITFNEKSNEIKRSWLLPILKSNVQNSTIQFFIDYFLPLASICRKKAEEYKTSNTAGNISYTLLQTQIWSLLPSFCTKPKDVENFGNIAKMLGNVLTCYKDLRMTVMLSLRKLIEHNPDSPVLKKYAKNYLPILLNIYTQNGEDESVRTSAQQTIILYASIADTNIRSELLKSALGKLDNVGSDEDNTKNKSKEEIKFLKSNILEIIRVLFIYQDEETIDNIVSKYIFGIIQDPKDTQETKKAYKILRELCESTEEGPRAFMENHMDSILSLLLEPMEKKSAIPSQSSRIKCLTAVLLKLNESQILDIIPAAVSGIKSTNTKCRGFAFELVAKIADQMIELKQEQGLFDFVDHLSVGLEGNPKLISATILALASVTHHTRHVLEETETLNTVIDNVLVLLTSSTREIVASCLSYLKLLLTSFHKDKVHAYLAKIVKNISAMVQDCKRHFRCKIKDIFTRLLRKYGDSVVFQLVPSHDEVLIKQVKNLIRIRRQKEKNKNRRKTSESENEDDEDEFNVKSKPKTINEILEEIEKDDDEDLLDVNENTNKQKDKKKKKKKETFIQENDDDIMDFTEITNMNKISTSKPMPSTSSAVASVKTKKKDEFKMSADGRLIITESGDESDVSETDKLRNMKIKDESEEEEEESKTDAKQILMNSRKRKRSTDASSVRSEPHSKYQAGGSGIHRPINRKSEPLRKDSTPGAVYKSKKSQGDMKRKGLPDPYAYVPLTRKLLNRRKKNKSSGQFKSIIKGAKKGAKVGQSLKTKKQKNKKK